MDFYTQLNQINQKLIPKNYIAVGYEALAFTTAGAKTPTVPEGVEYAEVIIESSVTTGIIGRRLNLGDGTLPTSTVGMAVSHLDFFDITGSDAISRFRIILTTAGTHVAHIQYYKK